MKRVLGVLVVLIAVVVAFLLAKQNPIAFTIVNPAIEPILPEMADIPAGSFQRGNPSGTDFEKPVRTLAFAPLVDCILMVVHPRTPFRDINRTLDLVPKEKFLGFVLNNVKISNGNYYYRYKYGSRKGK